jgi:hypothetical protein
MWSAVVLARQLIRPQALIRGTRPAQANAGPFISCLEEDHTLVLKSDPDGSHGGSRSTPVTIRLRPFDSMDGQARASGKLRLRQSKERPSGSQLSGSDYFRLTHRDHASADQQVSTRLSQINAGDDDLATQEGAKTTAMILTVRQAHSGDRYAYQPILARSGRRRNFRTAAVRELSESGGRRRIVETRR